MSDLFFPHTVNKVMYSSELLFYLLYKHIQMTPSNNPCLSVPCEDLTPNELSKMDSKLIMKVHKVLPIKSGIINFETKE